MRYLSFLSLLFLLSSACTSSDRSADFPAEEQFSNLPPYGEGTEIGTSYELLVNTESCIEFAVIDGSWWATTPIEGPPDGWGTPFDTGKVKLIDIDTAEYEGPDGTIVFERTEFPAASSPSGSPPDDRPAPTYSCPTTEPTPVVVDIEAAFPAPDPETTDAGAAACAASAAVEAFEGESVAVFDSMGDVHCVGPAFFTGGILSATASLGGTNGSAWQVNPTFSEEGIELFNAAAAQCFEQTLSCPTRRLAIIINDSTVLTAPQIQTPFFNRDQIQITGDFTPETASNISAIINQLPEAISFHPVIDEPFGTDE